MRLHATEPLIPKCVWWFCLQISLPCSAACKLAHALRTRTKVNALGPRPSCGICWRNSTVFLYLPSFDVQFCSFKQNYEVHSATAVIFASIEGVLSNCLCSHAWNLDASDSPMTINLNWADQLGILRSLHSQKHHCATEKATDLSISKLTVTTIIFISFCNQWSQHCEGSERAAKSSLPGIWMHSSPFAVVSQAILCVMS